MRVGSVHAVHHARPHAVLMAVDSCISQVARSVYTRHSIQDDHVGEKKSEVTRLFFCLPWSQTLLLVAVYWPSCSSSTAAARAPQQQRQQFFGFGRFRNNLLNLRARWWMSLTSPNDFGSPRVDASCGRADPMKRCVADTRPHCYLVMVSVQGFTPSRPI